MTKDSVDVDDLDLPSTTFEKSINDNRIRVTGARKKTVVTIEDLGPEDEPGEGRTRTKDLESLKFDIENDVVTPVQTEEEKSEDGDELGVISDIDDMNVEETKSFVEKCLEEFDKVGYEDEVEFLDDVLDYEDGHKSRTTIQKFLEKRRNHLTEFDEDED